MRATSRPSSPAPRGPSPSSPPLTRSRHHSSAVQSSASRSLSLLPPLPHLLPRGRQHLVGTSDVGLYIKRTRGVDEWRTFLGAVGRGIGTDRSLEPPSRGNGQPRVTGCGGGGGHPRRRRSTGDLKAQSSSRLILSGSRLASPSMQAGQAVALFSWAGWPRERDLLGHSQY
jgi:hypothetical protein